VQLSCKIVFSYLETTTDSSFEIPRDSTDWTHVACVYNSSHLCVATNGTLRACRVGTYVRVRVCMCVRWRDARDSPSCVNSVGTSDHDHQHAALRGPYV
jgi:hypothetical protein